MVSLLKKLFNKNKMTIEQLKQENDALKAQIMGISHNLRITDEKLKQYEMQIDSLHKQNLNLVGEVKHLNMKMSVNNNNQNDSRNY
jgi:chromosome segregation ATPase